MQKPRKTASGIQTSTTHLQEEVVGSSNNEFLRDHSIRRQFVGKTGALENNGLGSAKDFIDIDRSVQLSVNYGGIIRQKQSFLNV